MALNFTTFYPDIDEHALRSNGITFGIKIQIDNQPPFISTFRNEGMILDITLATCLSPVFTSQTIATNGLQELPLDMPNPMGHFIIGTAPVLDTSYASIELLDTENKFGLDSSTASVILVAHNQASLEYDLNRSIVPTAEYENDYEGWITHLENLSVAEKEALYQTELNRKIINKKHTVTFLRKSGTDGYSDLFDVLLKAKKIAKPIAKFALTPAPVQTDKIVFTSLCQLQTL